MIQELGSPVMGPQPSGLSLSNDIRQRAIHQLGPSKTSTGASPWVWHISSHLSTLGGCENSPPNRPSHRRHGSHMNPCHLVDDGCLMDGGHPVGPKSPGTGAGSFEDRRMINIESEPPTSSGILTSGWGTCPRPCHRRRSLSLVRTVPRI